MVLANLMTLNGPGRVSPSLWIPQLPMPLSPLSPCMAGVNWLLGGSWGIFYWGKAKPKCQGVKYVLQ